MHQQSTIRKNVLVANVSSVVNETLNGKATPNGIEKQETSSGNIHWKSKNVGKGKK